MPLTFHIKYTFFFFFLGKVYQLYIWFQKWGKRQANKILLEIIEIYSQTTLNIIGLTVRFELVIWSMLDWWLWYLWVKHSITPHVGQIIISFGSNTPTNWVEESTTGSFYWKSKTLKINTILLHEMPWVCSNRSRFHGKSGPLVNIRINMYYC